MWQAMLTKLAGGYGPGALLMTLRKMMTWMMTWMMVMMMR